MKHDNQMHGKKNNFVIENLKGPKQICNRNTENNTEIEIQEIINNILW